ncbi:hypothetical protein [Amycolatopsis australiensis]|uniref:Uncharacterized protein n=1 Tax=Amycolatopsis australiensis TaxID=546364 RepID=A0A1K1QD97_9PSEU|nr:hypothetical protein [Amycolatopsis australiensis]SFW57673.1 hypothetical protein SAMN04489730_1637 [Amycolatopsis australiensis]
MVLAAGDRPVAEVMGLVFGVVVIVAGVTLNIVRVVRSTKPREKQMALLAAQLDGRNQVYLRMIENGLAERDLAWVAGTRGYSVIVHRSFKYYEFIYTPHQPGRIA